MAWSGPSRSTSHYRASARPYAFLYGFWSSRKTIIVMAGVSAAALAGFVIEGNRLAQNHLLLHVLLIVPIWGISSLTAVTAAYAAEVYPTRVRGRGTGLAAAATKLGGVAILAAVVASVAAPSISATALRGTADAGHHPDRPLRVGDPAKGARGHHS